MTAGVKTVFGRALEIESPAERAAYLEQACEGDEQLRAELEELLSAAGQAGSFLNRPAADPQVFSPTVIDSPLTERPGSIIGPYKLLQQIGEGGFGVVYMAEQERPVRRIVALKIIKPGMDSREVIARFEAERQALAMMDHQNIARVLDAGATDTGRPYFVMELVKGIPITDYCNNNRLSPRERLELFVPVCQAIQHAHQKGIIHRDIKPSNVLVCLYDGQPVPKVIDFGVAKAIEQRLTEKTMFTRHGQVVGTLEYMSPEQAELSQLDVDTRSDIYSLGVLLYELLTGTTPITKEQLRLAGFTEMLRMIRETEPERPSIRLSHSHATLATISAQRRTEPARLGALLKGEVDWIVMKALEKDRTRRYETAVGLARDIERHLRDEPVEACPPRLSYRLRKVLRRHRRTAAVGAVVGVLLILVLVNHFVGYVRLKEARGRAAAESNRARMAAADAEAAEREAQQDRARALAALDRAQEAERKTELEMQRARAAEQRATADRDRAVAAEHEAQRQRDLEVQSRENATAALTQSLYEQARAVRLTGQPGRRMQSLELLREAERLRSGPRAGEEQQPLPPAELPGPAEVRSEAVAALLLRDGRVAQQWEGVTHAVSPDGRFMASMWFDPVKPDGGLRLVDLETGNDVTPAPLARNEAAMGVALALGPSARCLASVPYDSHSVNIIDRESGRTIRTLSLPPMATEGDPTPAPGAEPASRSLLDRMAGYGMIRHVILSPDAQFLAAVRLVAPRLDVIVWHLGDEDDSEGRIAGTIRDMPLSLPVFSPDGRWLAIPAGGRNVAVWSLNEARVQQTIELPQTIGGAIGFAPDGRLACLCAAESPANRAGSLILWDLAADRESLQVPTRTGEAGLHVAFTPDGRRFALAIPSGTIEVYDLPAGADAAAADNQPAGEPVVVDHGAAPQLLAWGVGGRHLLTGGIGALKRWELAGATALTAIRLGDGSPDEVRGGTPSEKPAGGTGPVVQFAFDPLNRYVAAERPGRPLALYDRQTGRVVRELDGDATTGTTLAFSSDGRRLARLNRLRLRVWEVDTGEQRLELPVSTIEDGALSSFGFAADGRVLAGGTQERQPVVFDAATGAVELQIPESPAGVALISPDGRWAMPYSFLSAIRTGIPLFDVERQAEHVRLERVERSSLTASVGFSADSRKVLVLHVDYPLSTAAGFNNAGHGLTVIGRSSDGWTGDLFDVRTGRLEMSFEGPSMPAEHAFSPDGRWLAISLRSGLVIVYDLSDRRELFRWQAWPDDGQLASGVRRLAFTPDGTSLAVADAARPVLYLLDLQELNRQLGEVALGW